VLYGRGASPRAICVPERELRRVLSGSHGLHTILDVLLEGRSSVHPSILKEFQRDPVRGYVSHVDLMEVRLDQPIQAAVAVELVGEPEGVTEGGVLSQVNREVNVEALPMEIPERLELDVTGLQINDTLRLSDLPPREGVTYLDDPDETVLATVTPPTRIIEPEEVEPEEGVEVPEGEEGAAEVPAEPTAGEGEAAQGESDSGSD
jgi:large subunit ribosomal protein L25